MCMHLFEGYSKGLRVFNYSELLVATSDFMNLIGRGGFGKVYKGDYHGTELAVKVLNEAVVLYYVIAYVMCVLFGFYSFRMPSQSHLRVH